MTRQTMEGLPVENATEPLRLVVEDCDIEGAVRQDPENCVAARTIMRMHGAFRVLVHRSRTFVQWHRGDSFIRYATPAVLRDASIIFDRGGKAFRDTLERRITLQPVAPANRATGQRQGGADKPRTGRMRRPRRVLTNVRPHA